jgi:hypothetical protein
MMSTEILVGVENLQNEKWECVFSPRKEMKGHKVFKRRKQFSDGYRYSIADWSGNYPDDTDDGPLWINLDEPLIVRPPMPLRENPDQHEYLMKTRRMIVWDDGNNTTLGKSTFRFLKEELMMDVLFKQYRQSNCLVKQTKDK